MKYPLFSTILLIWTTAFSSEYHPPTHSFIATKTAENIFDDNPVVFLADVYSVTAYFTNKGVYFRKKSKDNHSSFFDAIDVLKKEKQVIAILFNNANTQKITGEAKLDFPLLIGDRHTQETKSFELYNTIRYSDVYPNIDVVFSLPDQGGLKYEFILHEGADINDIKVVYEGADKVELNENNELVVSGEQFDLIEKNLMAYYKNNYNKEIPVRL